MSVREMNAVWEDSPHGGSKLLLLLAIADNANDHGIAWPSQETLAKKIRMSERQVRRLSAELEEAGALTMTRKRVGSKTHITYQLLTIPTGQVVLTDPIQPDISEFQPDIAVSAEPSIEPSEDQDLAADAANQETGRKRNPVWDALEAVMGYKPATTSEQTAFAKTVREIEKLVPGGSTQEQVEKAMRARRAAWERHFDGLRFTHRVLAARWAELGALAVGGGAASVAAFPSERMSPEEFREWRRTASREDVVEYQHRFDVDDSGEPVDGGF